MRISSLLNIPKTKYPARRILAWLWDRWRGNRLQALANASIGVADVGLSLAQVWAVKRAIDVAAGNTEGSIYWAVGVMAALILGSFAANIASVWVRNVLGIRAQNRMQQATLERIMQAQWHSRSRRHSGDILNRLEFDVSTVVTFLTETVPNTLSVVMMFAGAFLYLFSMDRVLAVLLVAIIPLFLAVSKIYMRQMRRLTRLVRDSDSRVQAVMQETIQHRMVIKTLEAGPDMVARLERTQAHLRENVMRRTSFSVFSNFILNFGFALGYLIAFLWAAVRMSAGTLTFGGMTAFLQLVNKIQNPARNLTKLAPAFVGVFTAAERLMELEDEPAEEQGDPIRIDAPCGLRLDDISYRYEDGTHDVISHLSFDFRPGSCTAIIGETGAGKTTLVRMLLSLMKPQSGRITIYNDSTERELSPLMRCNFVYVPQGNTLMSGTIRDNLRLGRQSATDEEMRAALTMSCADFVLALPEGLDTRCGERGGGLSEGQAQRIAIARALLRDRQIMVFDEATSALDSDTECRLLRNILANNSRTVIFITHRPAVLDYCTEQLRL